MKKHIWALPVCIAFLLFCLSGCSMLDKDYGKSEPTPLRSEHEVGVKIPEIKSDDRIMPTYFDISLYDEENYADIYLGKDFKYKATYSGNLLSLPAGYKDMIKNGWSLSPDSEGLELDSKIMAGKSIEAQFEDSYGKRITAVFYNKSSSSKSLISCPIVKFVIAENFLYNPDSVYGQFWVNGVTNESAITDVIECLGAPSHFYAVDDNNYYLDYFLTEKDRRSKITVYIDIENDSVSRMEFSLY